jgi:hypothetical protein
MEQAMPNLVRVTIGDTNVWMEAEEEAGGAPERVSVADTLAHAVATAERITETIRAYSTLVVKAFREGTQDAPSKITAEFGIKLGGEGNVYIVKTTGEASVKVTAEWTPK